jgi:translation initiation factor IF-2
MTQDNTNIRISKVINEFNIGIQTINEFLKKKGLVKEDLKPTAKIEQEWYALLMKEFQGEKNIKQQSMKASAAIEKKEAVTIEPEKPLEKKEPVVSQTSEAIQTEKKASKAEVAKKTEVIAKKPDEKTKTTVDEEKKKKPAEPEKVETEVKDAEKELKDEVIKAEKIELAGLKVIDKIDLESTKTKSKKTKQKKEEKTEVESTEQDQKKPKEEQEKEDLLKPESEQTEIEKKQEQEEVIIEFTEDTALEVKEKEPEVQIPDDMMETHYEKLSGPTIVGKIDLARFDRKPDKTDKKEKEKEKEKVKEKEKEKLKVKDGKVPVASSHDDKVKKRKRKRIEKSGDSAKGKERPGDKARPVVEVSDEEIQKQIKETLARLTSSGKSKASKYRRQKRDIVQQHQQAELEEFEKQKNVLKVTEFLTANDLSSMMNVHVNQVISTCLNLGLFVSINQRLDAEAITLVADEFGYDVEFVSDEADDQIVAEQENPETLLPRHPVVTVMGHVDHGKTSLLDYIRKSNVIAGEAGGITQHIGAYEVQLPEEKKITFLDTPGHEAFTAMRARGAKLTDIAIIVVAADDRVMPQTVEAINHARAANVPMVFAINKIDKPNSNPEKIKEELSMMNILVEDWGGKFQSQEISAKQGVNIELLLEKVLLEAELLDLKANPDKPAIGAVIESSLEKGRGYVSKILIQSGTLRVGDIAVAGSFHGKVKAMFNERNQPISEAGPSTPVLMLGLDGAPQAGDRFGVYETEREAKQVAVKRQQLLREQGLRTQKHITLDEIGRRIAIGDFKELNIIVKGDVDGSIEALSDSLLKLSSSSQQVQVNVIHKSVGQITESDVLLASASDAIIVGFQVRPSVNARKLAEAEQIDIRTYSVIYDAIEEIKAAIEGMLSPTLEEKIVGNIEVREVFKITKVGTVAGCMVLDGKVNRNTRIRIIRDGIVIYEGALSTLKRFKDDVKEVSAGYECGLSIESFNDLKVGDIIEGFDIIEKKTKL